MKIVVAGTGAMGSVYAGLLADAGNEVWALDLDQKQIDAIRANGLRVEGDSGDRTVTSIQATTNPGDIAHTDLVIIATKASGVAPVTESLQHAMDAHTVVLTIQNGLGAGERIAGLLKDKVLLLGVAGGFGAVMRGPGHVYHNHMGLIRIGELQGGHSDPAERIAQLWMDAGFNVKTYEDINQLIWEKFVCNVAFSAPCTVFERTLGEIMNDPVTWRISLSCAREAYAVGKARSVNFSFDDIDQYIHDFGKQMPDARPSMLLDHIARVPSEIDFINGMVPVVAEEQGMNAPYNEVMSALVRIREAGFQSDSV